MEILLVTRLGSYQRGVVGEVCSAAVLLCVWWRRGFTVIKSRSERFLLQRANFTKVSLLSVRICATLPQSLPACFFARFPFGHNSRTHLEKLGFKIGHSYRCCFLLILWLSEMDWFFLSRTIICNLVSYWHVVLLFFWTRQKNMSWVKLATRKYMFTVSYSAKFRQYH